MINIRLVSIGTILLCVSVHRPAWAQHANELRIGFELPTDDRQGDAAHLVAAASARRNLEIQSCANGGDKTACERSAEISFRLDVSHIPGVRFELCYDKDENSQQCTSICDLKPEEATSRDLDQTFHHLEQPGSFSKIGVYVDNGRLVKDSHENPLDPHIDDFVRIVCYLVQKGENASSLMRELLDGEEMPNEQDLRFLVEHSGELNSKYRWQDAIIVPGTRTPLITAVYRGHKETIELLLDLGADVNGTNFEGDTAMFEAARSGRSDEVRLLIDHGANVNAKDVNGATALGRAGTTAVAELLLERGVDVNAVDTGGCTALIEAAQRENTKVIEFLLNHGANVNAKDRDGRTVLDWAGDDKTRHLILKHGAMTGSDLDKPSPRINIVFCGVMLLIVFGAITLVIVWRGKAKA